MLWAIANSPIPDLLRLFLSFSFRIFNSDWVRVRICVCTFLIQNIAICLRCSITKPGSHYSSQLGFIGSAFTGNTAAFSYNRIVKHFPSIIRAFHWHACSGKILGLATQALDMNEWQTDICNCLWFAETLTRRLANGLRIGAAKLINNAFIFCMNVAKLDVTPSCG